MKTLLKIIILGLFFPVALSGQGFLLGFQSGISTFGMKELKKLNSYVALYSQVEPELVHDYPPWFYYRATLTSDWKYFYLQMDITTTSTGSRYSIYDYSGEYLYDTKIKAFNPMFGIGIYLNHNNNLHFSLCNNVGFYYTDFEMNEFFTLSDENYYDELNRFKSRNLCWEPGIKCSWRKSFFEISGYFGYLVQFDGEGLYFENIQGWYFNPSYSIDPIEPGWNGIRSGIEVAFYLPYKTLFNMMSNE